MTESKKDEEIIEMASDEDGVYTPVAVTRIKPGDKYVPSHFPQPQAPHRGMRQMSGPLMPSSPMPIYNKSLWITNEILKGFIVGLDIVDGIVERFQETKKKRRRS